MYNSPLLGNINNHKHMPRLKRIHLSPDDFLYFHHIPKTAGTTLHNILGNFVPSEQVCPARLWKHLLTIPSEQFIQYRLFSGHFYYYINQLLPRNPITITMLRDPIQRSISHYLHIHRESFLYYHEQAVSGDMLSFVTDPVTRPQIENFQTKLIALTLDPDLIKKEWGDANFSEYSLNHFDHWLELPTRLSDEALLERAKTRLEEFAFVGITEQFTESMLLLWYTFYRAPELTIESKNVAPESLSQDTLSAATIEALQEATQLDAALYSFAQQLFQSRFQQMALELQLQVSELQQEIITLRAAGETLSETSAVQDKDDTTLYSFEQHLQNLNTLFHKYEVARTRSDLIPGLSKLPIVGFFIRTLMRIIFSGKVWAAERHLLHEIINALSDLHIQAGRGNDRPHKPI